MGGICCRNRAAPPPHQLMTRVPRETRPGRRLVLQAVALNGYAPIAPQCCSFWGIVARQPYPGCPGGNGASYPWFVAFQGKEQTGSGRFGAKGLLHTAEAVARVVRHIGEKRKAARELGGRINRFRGAGHITAWWALPAMVDRGRRWPRQPVQTAHTQPLGCLCEFGLAA